MYGYSSCQQFACWLPDDFFAIENIKVKTTLSVIISLSDNLVIITVDKS